MAISIEQYKRLAGIACDKLKATGANWEFQQVVYDSIMKTRTTKGYNAALLAGLVVGALIERGENDLASAVLHEIARAG